ncbi:DoxX family protein [Nocardiopsis sp. RSe5-2]|uniref:DoxX family protein n=1 Tax=Nocardiopsis endophytica TaxID=3018445 RepID=A0ABT4U362_9ACTN|nr:DoxX family protein [Nocardiopsis endophytica]MDA2811402.1 DoxX family protein [Nocardiopsis endophytica]
MTIAYIAVTLLAAAMVGFSAVVLYRGVDWIAHSMEIYGVPRSWWPWLSAAKAAGALGLLVGLFVPAIGAAAGIGLVLYFIGAEITVLRARRYSHIPAPLLYLAPVAASLWLGSAV